jgi:cytochrome c oxidase subunit 4
MTRLRTPLLVWLSLLALLAITALSSRIDLGGLNAAINLTIAAIKSLLILLFYMRLRDAGTLPRLAAAGIGLWLAILYGLTLSDYATR